MAKSARLDTLTVKHAELDARIKEEMRSLVPDHLRISDIKRQKLSLKEEIKQLSATG